jgi:hypothetical protein
MHLQIPQSFQLKGPLLPFLRRLYVCVHEYHRDRLDEADVELIGAENGKLIPTLHVAKVST